MSMPGGPECMETFWKFCVSVLIQPLLPTMSDVRPVGESDSWVRVGEALRETGARDSRMLGRQRVNVGSLSTRAWVVAGGAKTGA